MKTKQVLKRKMKFFFFLLSCCIILQPHKIFAQSGVSCDSTIVMPTGMPSCVNNVMSNNLDVWFSFTAPASSVQFQLTNSTDTTKAHIHQLDLYGGTCSSLALIGSATVDSNGNVNLLASGLTQGTTYYLDASHHFGGTCRRCAQTTTDFNICMQLVCVLQISPPDTTICIGSCVNWQNTSYGPNGSPPAGCFDNYYWTMPGGTPSTYLGFQPPCVTYNTLGTYTVTLYEVDSTANGYVIDSANHVSSIVHVITVPSLNISLSPNPVCVNDPFTIIINASGETSLTVDFGDGNTQTYTTILPSSISYGYSLPGTYTINVCATNQCGITCASQAEIVNGASACFTYQSSCRVNFFDDSICTGSILSESWNFGDNATATGSNPSHVYGLNNFLYTVTHTVITTYGDTLTCSQTVSQSGGPSAAITGQAANNCENGTLTYTAPCVTGITYFWSAVGSIPNNATGTGCTFNVNWSYAGGTIYLTAFDSITDCQTKDSIVIPPCCVIANPLAVNLNNTSASQVLMDTLYAPYITGSTFSDPNIIIINGIFTVDVNFTFQNCPQIELGANAKIKINPGVVFTMNNSTTDIVCGKMWDGIYISDSTSLLNITNTSLVQQARNAVVSDNGGKYFIDNSHLKNNEYDIIVHANPGTNNSIIRRTKLDMAGSFLPAVSPPLPFYANKTLAAIVIDKNAAITIGDATIALYQNHFDNIHVGILSTNSRTTAINDKFTNIGQVPASAVQFSGRAIVATGGQLSFQPLIFVGGLTSNSSCIFQNIGVAVYAATQMDVNVENNVATDIRTDGVWVQSCRSRGINIDRNTLSNYSYGQPFSFGILVNDVPMARVNITNNSIQAPVSAANNFTKQVGTGIRVANPSPSIVRLNIVNNTNIIRVQTGIWLTNVIGKNLVYVKQNRISFTKPNNFYTGVHYGIRLEGCGNVIVDSNFVQKSQPNPVSAMVQNLRGISIENSPASLVIHNHFVRMGSGIYGYAISSQSTLACNTMDHCFDGVFFIGPLSTGNACDIGNQVLNPTNGNPAATGNTWIASGNTDVFGTVNPGVNWYDNPIPLHITTGISYTINNNNLCGSIFLLAAQQQQIAARDEQAGSVLRSIAQNNPGADETYLMRRHVHRLLTQNPSWLNLNTSDDTLYQNFFNAYNPTNIGTLRQAEVAVDSGMSLMVSTLSSSINPSNVIEQNLQIINDIYASTWMNGVYGFSPADSATLLSIAMLNPDDAGTGVYNARVLLGLKVDDFGSSSQRVAENQQQHNVVTTATFNVYPNPASESFSVEIEIGDGQNAQLQLYNITGQLMLKQQLVPQQQIYAVGSTGLQAGVYILRVVIDGVATESKRLIIVK